MAKTTVGEELGGVLSAVIGEGRFVCVSGQGPLRDGAYEPASIEAETRLTLSNLAHRSRRPERRSRTSCAPASSSPTSITSRR